MGVSRSKKRQVRSACWHLCSSQTVEDSSLVGEKEVLCHTKGPPATAFDGSASPATRDWAFAVHQDVGGQSEVFVVEGTVIEGNWESVGIGGRIDSEMLKGVYLQIEL